MLISRVKIKNFGKIVQGDYHFVDGLNIIRAPNEGGKTTMIEAMLYGLFGSSVVRGTIDEAVTDGASSMKVEVQFGDYEAVRTKTSASVTGPDVQISGQNNVTDFFCDLIGVNKNTISNIVWSDQGETAGILKGKPTAVMNFIEELAGFDQIDGIIQKAKEEFPEGNAALYEEMITEHEAEIKKLKEQEFTPIQPLTDERLKLEDERNSLQASIDEHNKEKSKLINEISLADQKNKLRTNIINNISACEKRIASYKLSIKQLNDSKPEEVADISHEEEFIRNYNKLEKEYALYNTINAFEWSGPEWEGDEESFKLFLSTAKEKEVKIRDRIILCKNEIKTQKSRINEKENCDLCGQDITHLHKDINDKAKKKIDELIKKLAFEESELVEVRGELEDCLAIAEEQRRREAYREFADTSIIPWPLKWNKDEPVVPSEADLAKAQAKVRKADQDRDRLDYVNKQIPVEEGRLAEESRVLSRYQEELKNKKHVDTEDLTAKKSAIDKEVADLGLKVSALSNKISDLLDSEMAIVDSKRQRDNSVKVLTDKVDELVQKLSNDKKNTAFIRELRNAKPAVLNLVWQRILVAVSQIFSVMRQEESVVERRDKGFYINGQPAHRLSGSARAILGIAIRRTLRDVFAPSAGFMIFDEPASDCDDTRKASVISTLNTIPGQVIMITHEDMSDSVANNIIEM